MKDDRIVDLDRDVRLSHDVTRWYHDLVMIWDDWWIPLLHFMVSLFTLVPVMGKLKYMLTLSFFNMYKPTCALSIVAIVDSLDDPWHPRMLCLTVPRILSHTVLCGYIDLDGICGTTARCRTLLGDRDLTDLQQFEVENGMHLVFSHPS